MSGMDLDEDYCVKEIDRCLKRCRKDMSRLADRVAFIEGYYDNFQSVKSAPFGVQQVVKTAVSSFVNEIALIIYRLLDAKDPLKGKRAGQGDLTLARACEIYQHASDKFPDFHSRHVNLSRIKGKDIAIAIADVLSQKDNPAYISLRNYRNEYVAHSSDSANTRKVEHDELNPLLVRDLLTYAVELMEMLIRFHEAWRIWEFISPRQNIEISRGIYQEFWDDLASRSPDSPA